VIFRFSEDHSDLMLKQRNMFYELCFLTTAKHVQLLFLDIPSYEETVNRKMGKITQWTTAVHLLSLGWLNLKENKIGRTCSTHGKN